jgi:cell division protein FtsX
MSSLQNLAAWVGLLGGAAGFISVLLNWWQIRISSPRIVVDHSLPNTPHHSSYLAEDLAVIAIDWFKGWVGG